MLGTYLFFNVPVTLFIVRRIPYFFSDNGFKVFQRIGGSLPTGSMETYKEQHHKNMETLVVLGHIYAFAFLQKYSYTLARVFDSPAMSQKENL
jgi:hypothetical protein